MGRTKRPLLAGVCLVLHLAATAGLSAQLSSPDTGGEELGRYLSSFENLPPTIYRPDLVVPGIQRALTVRHRGYQNFLAAHPGGWRVEWNETAGTPHRIYGGDLFLRLPDGRLPRGGDELAEALRELIGRHRELFGVDPRDLVLSASRELGSFQFVRLTQDHRGIPVLGSRVELRVAPGGRVLLLGCDVLPSRLLHGCELVPRIDAAQAEDCVRGHALDDGALFRCEPSGLVLVPTYEGRQLTARLAWEVRQAGGDLPSRWVYLIAAADEADRENPSRRRGRAGDVLGRWDRVSRGSISGVVRAMATPGLFPDVDWNPPAVEPLGQLRVSANSSSVITRPDGSFELTYPGNGSPRVTVALEGPFVRVTSAAGGDLGFSRTASSGSVLDIDLNSSPSEFGTSQINAFLQVNVAHDYVKELDPDFTAVDVPVLAVVNEDDVCNAYFLPVNNGILLLVRSGPCANSAYSTVIHHEYGHLVVWRTFGTVIPMPAYNEGAADVFAALLTDQPVVGDSFNGVQGGFPVRDLSGPSILYPHQLLLGPHTAGLILGGAVWEMRERLGVALGSAEGLNLTRRLFHASLFLAPPMISPDVVLDFLQLDDDDGLLKNGTPHLSEIAGAFSTRGLHLPGELTIHHDRLGDSASGGPFLVQALVDSDFDFILPGAVELHHSSDGGSFTRVSMSPPGGGEYEAEIPAQLPGVTVRYYIEARGTGGTRAVYPEGAPLVETVTFAVGELEVVFSDDFDGPGRGWTHGTIPNGSGANEDDWQWGTPGTGTLAVDDFLDGNLLDPRTAFSPPDCWGNDLALSSSTNKNYSSFSRNFLQSPPIDCTGKFGLRLRFRRWLTLERADRARVLVEGVPVMNSSTDGDTIDFQWRAMDYDISALADDRPGVTIRFELSSGEVGNAGGWNIDDVELVATEEPPFPRPTITSVEPGFDFKDGGAPFTLRGSGFTFRDDIRLHFGASPVVDFTLVGEDTITGIVPPSSQSGLVVILVETSGGSASLVGVFSYFDLPRLDSVDPPRGSLAGGVLLTFHGDFFTPGTSVLVGGKPVQPLTRLGPDILLGPLPVGDDIGPVEVGIQSDYGESRFPGAFTYAEPPTLSALEPVWGPVAGGVRFQLTGTFFPDEESEVSIDFGSMRVVEFQVEGRGIITGTVPPALEPGPVDIRITTPGGSALLPPGFQYVDTSEEIFVRGDPDLDEKLGIVDAILVLDHLFQAGAELPCLDAADTNDDGVVDIADPVGLLFFLFGGAPPPVLPYPVPGSDPTGDGIECAQGLSLPGGKV